MARIRRAERRDAERLNAALAALSDHLGDRHRAAAADLLKAGWGETPVFRAQIAEADAALVGAALYSPVFSTTRGAAGLFVSDLWVAAGARGSGLGRRLLAAAAADAAAGWGADFLKLSVYDDNDDARAAYLAMGFAAHETETNLSLDAAGLRRLETR